VVELPAIEFRKVDVIFGEGPKRALALLDAGHDREAIQAQTGNVVGVADASLAVQNGQICVLMGLSGSGKSTLLRSVNGLNAVTRGEVLVTHDGRQVDVASCDRRTLRHLRSHRIAMVFQQFALLPWRSVRENVGLGLELRGATRAERQKVVEEKLALVGLEDWSDKAVHELSGGMQQRVGLARAFATDADILLMDEPFSALDPLIRSKLQDELLGLQQSLQKTILFVSHDLDEALKLGNQIAIMEGGHIVQQGDAEEIVLNPASDYVAEFVAHMNPLQVLRGHSLMTPAQEMRRHDGSLLLDDEGLLRLELDGQGRPRKLLVEDRNARLITWRPHMDRREVAGADLVLAASDLTLRDAIRLRHASGRPVALTDAEGRFVGICGDDEIYRGLLRRSEQAKRQRDSARR